MSPTICIILAPRGDAHAHAVAHATARLGGTAHILDSREFTRLFDMRTRIGMRDASLRVSGASISGSIEASTISGIWYRRPFGYAYGSTRSGDNTGMAKLAEMERRAALIGSLDGFVGRAFNDIGRSRQANHKPAQLMRARQIGLTIPETLITNEPAAVEEFIDLVDGQVVYKMSGSPPDGLFGTRLLEQEDMGRLDRLASCPAIFQEFIDGDFDIRATVVGDKVFAARIVFERGRSHVDTRFVKTEIMAHVLPREIETKLLELVKSFGLVYSAIDLRYSETRGYVFFESNPEGQYLWTEIEADLPISHELALQLIG